jgi:hypothetical protein
MSMTDMLKSTYKSTYPPTNIIKLSHGPQHESSLQDLETHHTGANSCTHAAGSSLWRNAEVCVPARRPGMSLSGAQIDIRNCGSTTRHRILLVSSHGRAWAQSPASPVILGARLCVLEAQPALPVPQSGPLHANLTRRGMQLRPAGQRPVPWR